MPLCTAIQWQRAPPRLRLLDQRLLPGVVSYVDVPDADAGWHAIKVRAGRAGGGAMGGRLAAPPPRGVIPSLLDPSPPLQDMVVRGAPALAVAAALALAVEAAAGDWPDAAAAADHLRARAAFLATARPTAVNLGEAMARMTEAVDGAVGKAGASGASVADAAIDAADAYLSADVATNVALGKVGADAVLATMTGETEGAVILTHCNAGALATAGHGTALGVVRELAARGRLAHAFCTETRPYNQGARLTAFELATEGLPATLIVDSAAAGLLIHGGAAAPNAAHAWSGRPTAVVVGADRVAANGDTANKVGTLALAVAAARAGVPFFVAAPTTTLDGDVPNGDAITIEQRPPEEVTHADGGAGARVAAAGVDVWNPSFDVTPADLVTGGIITERGMVPRKGAGFDVAGFAARAAGAATAPPPPAAAPLDCAAAAAYVAARPTLAARVGDPTGADAAAWDVAEVGDGNLNFVFIVSGPAGSLVLKQALPYIRIAPDWPLAASRAGVEAAALEVHGALAPGRAPALFHFDRARSALAMERVPEPAAVVRPLLVRGAILPGLVGDVAEYCARTLFGTSPLALGPAAWRSLAARFDNPALCELTEKVIFVDPFCGAATNQVKEGDVAAWVAALRSDASAAAASARMLARFASVRQAVLHGDLHTGSVMALPDGGGRAVVIDPEFAVAGPVGFDVGKFAANLLIAHLAADGRRSSAGGPHDDDAVDAQQAWLARAVPEFWAAFDARFRALWSAAAAAATPACATPPALFGPGAPVPDAALAATQDAYMADVYDDAVRFGGGVLLRRVVGIAAVEDFKAIPAPPARAACELRTLRLGRAMLAGGAAAFRGWGDVVAAARV